MVHWKHYLCKWWAVVQYLNLHLIYDNDTYDWFYVNFTTRSFETASLIISY